MGMHRGMQCCCPPEAHPDPRIEGHDDEEETWRARTAYDSQSWTCARVSDSILPAPCVSAPVWSRGPHGVGGSHLSACDAGRMLVSRWRQGGGETRLCHTDGALMSGA